MPKIHWVGNIYKANDRIRFQISSWIEQAWNRTIPISKENKSTHMKFLKIVLVSLFALIEVYQCKPLAESPNRPEKSILKSTLFSPIKENDIVKASEDKKMTHNLNWKMLDSFLGYIRSKRSSTRLALGPDCGHGFADRLIAGSNANEILQQEQSGSGQIRIFDPCRNHNNFFDGWGG